MRGKSLVLLVLALGCGLVASIGINQVLANRNGEAAPAEEMVKILVAAMDIPIHEPITAEMVRSEEWPKDKAPSDYLDNLAEVDGKVPTSPIFKDEPLRKNRLGKGETAGELITEGYRVVPVRVDANSGGAGLILPGNRVDVLMYMRETGANKVPRTQTILEDIKVFAVDNVFRQDPSGGEKTIVAKTISLLVTPSQAEKITLAEESGKVRLTLRSPKDREAAHPTGTDLSELLDPDSADRRKEEGFTSHPLGTETPANNLVDSIQQARADQPANPVPVEKAPDVFQMVLIERSEPRVVEFRDGKPLPDEVSRGTYGSSGNSGGGGSGLPPGVNPADIPGLQGGLPAGGLPGAGLPGAGLPGAGLPGAGMPAIPGLPNAGGDSSSTLEMLKKALPGLQKALGGSSAPQPPKE